jgi:hypothetical protein
MSVWALVGQGSDSVKGDLTDATGGLERRDGVCDSARGPCAREYTLGCLRAGLGGSLSTVGYVGMYAQRCESRLVILERSEGWPWLSGVMAPHGCAKVKNLCARDIWYQS